MAARRMGVGPEQLLQQGGRFDGESGDGGEEVEELFVSGRSRMSHAR